MSPITHPLTPRVAVACGCRLAEEVIWNARSNALIWVDIENPAIWRHWPATNETRRVAVDEKIGFALLTPNPDMVVAGLKSGVVLLDLVDGRRRPIVKPDPYPQGNRLNSGNIGPDGALWFGSMDDAELDDTGSFHRWDGATLTTFGGKAAVTNGPVVSPDGSRVYSIDTARGLVRVHDFDGDRIGMPRALITFDKSWGHPDGLTLDADAHLWICHYGGSRITRFTPEGEIERVVPVPTALVTKCAFGGPNLSTLYITTALRDRDPTIDPMAGHLFMVETDFSGFPGNMFEASRRVVP